MDNIIVRKAIVSEVLGLDMDEELDIEETVIWQQALSEYHYQIEDVKELISMLPNFDELSTSAKVEFIIELTNRLSFSREDVRIR